MEKTQDDATSTPVLVNSVSGQIDTPEEDQGGIQEDAENCADGSEIQVSKGKVLSNLLILSNIFSHLECPVLAGLRPVCKLWNEAVLMSPKFFKMHHIFVQRLFPCCTIAPVPKINPTLTKNVYVNDRFRNTHKSDHGGKKHDFKQAEDAAAYNLTTFFNQYHHSVENIKIYWRYPNSFPNYLVKALNVLDFPILQRIKIRDVGYCWHWGKCDENLISTFVTYLARPNLTSLQLDDTVAGSPFHDIFQKLINCAPNLEKITINGNFFPDLSTCKNLKILNYSGIQYCFIEIERFSEERSFNLESLSAMLDQAKHSLIQLGLKDSYHYLHCTPSDIDGHSQLEQFKFPDVASKLIILRIQENSKPFFQSELKKLSPARFPNLKNLSIEVKSLDNVLEGISYTFGTISTLNLSGTISPNIRHRVPILFPNLTSLTMPWSVGKGDEKSIFDSVIDFCSGWKLRKLHIRTALQIDSSALMKGLGRLKETQKVLRMLELPSQNNAPRGTSDPIFEFWYDAKKQQQQGGSVNVDIENLTFATHSMKAAMEGPVVEFILKHPLKIHFIV